MRSRAASSCPRSRTSARYKRSRSEPYCSRRPSNAADGDAASRSIPATLAPASSSPPIQIGPSLPSAPVTTATRPASGSAVLTAFLAPCGVGPCPSGLHGWPEVLERQRALLAQVHQQRPAHHVLQL